MFTVKLIAAATYRDVDPYSGRAQFAPVNHSGEGKIN